MKLIGLFGGTFNPVHLGHMHVAREVLAHTPIEQLRFLPCYQPVHRDTPTVSAEHRLAMLKLALADQPNLSIDTHELDRQGPSFMIDTLRALHKENPDQHLALILGFDAFASLPTWKEWETLADYCHFIVVNRPDSPELSGQFAQWVSARRCQDRQDLRHTKAGLIDYLTIPPSSISASDLRSDLANGVDASDRLPDGVMGYIVEWGLYSR